MATGENLVRCGTIVAVITTVLLDIRFPSIKHFGKGMFNICGKLCYLLRCIVLSLPSPVSHAIRVAYSSSCYG